MWTYPFSLQFTDVDFDKVLNGLESLEGDRDVTAYDIDNFDDWFAKALKIFQCYVAVEKRILFPWMDGAKRRKKHRWSCRDEWSWETRMVVE